MYDSDNTISSLNDNIKFGKLNGIAEISSDFYQHYIMDKLFYDENQLEKALYSYKIYLQAQLNIIQEILEK